MIRPHDSQSGAERQAENWLTVSRVGAMLVVPSIVIILGAFCAIKIIALVAARVIAAKETRLALAEVSVDHISPGLADLIAYLGSDGNIYTIAPDGSGRKQVTLDASDDPTDRVIYQGLAWSPNGKYLAYIRISPGPTTNPLVYLPDAFIYLPESDEQCQIDLQGQFSRLVWTADSSALLYDREVHWNNSGKPVDPIYGVWKYDLVGGQSSEVVPPAHQDPLVARSVSPEGRYISFNEIRYVDGPGFFGVFDLQTQTYPAWDQEGDLRPGSVDWSPDGQSLIFDEIDYGIRLGSQIWQADPNFEHITALTSPDPDYSAFHQRCAPNGDQIAYLYQQGQFSHPTELWVMDEDGSSQRRVASGVGLMSFTWSPDGKQLAYADKNGKAYNLVVVDAAGTQSMVIADGWQPEWRPKGPSPQY